MTDGTEKAYACSASVLTVVVGCTAGVLHIWDHCNSALKHPGPVPSQAASCTLRTCHVFLHPSGGHILSLSPTRNSAGAVTLARRPGSAYTILWS